LQHHRGVVSRPSHLLRIDTAKVKLGEVKLVDEIIDHPYRIVFGDIVFQLSWKHCSLAAICPAGEAAHLSPRILSAGEIPRQNQSRTKPDFSHSLGRFQTFPAQMVSSAIERGAELRLISRT